eukprot:UN33594
MSVSAEEQMNFQSFQTPEQKYELLWQNKERFPVDFQKKLLERKKLNDELKLICKNHPLYVYQRIHQLATSTYLSDYKASEGGKWKGKTWHVSMGLPTDAKLLMNLFSFYMDDYLSPHSFSKDYIRSERLTLSMDLLNQNKNLNLNSLDTQNSLNHLSSLGYKEHHEKQLRLLGLKNEQIKINYPKDICIVEANIE